MTDEEKQVVNENDNAEQTNSNNSDNFEIDIEHTSVISKEVGASFQTWSIPKVSVKDKSHFSEKYIKPEYFNKIQQDRKKQAYEETKRGYEEGFSKGKNEGQSKVQTQSDAIIANLNNLVAEFNKNLNEIQNTIPDAITSIVKCCVEKVVNYEINNNDIILKVVKSAVAELPSNCNNLKIKVNPEDKKVLEESINSKKLTEISTDSLEEDSNISRGGCMFSSLTSSLDATLEKRMNDINLELERDSNDS